MAEVLIVAIILTLLAVMVAPRLSSAANIEQESALRETLHDLRTQIMVYRAQHAGVAPGYPRGDTLTAPTYDAFLAQMTMYTNEQGDTSRIPSDEYKFGPYMERMPMNLINSNNDIRFMDSYDFGPVIAEGPEGWVYQPSTGTIAANLPGSDVHGASYTDY